MSVEFKCGGVYGFVTRQAANHPFRYKYHVYLSSTARHPKRHNFVLINSRPSGDCIRIDRSDWAGMTKTQSFILCSELFEYQTSDLRNAKYRDRLTDAALARLLRHIEKSETLTETDRDIILDALTGYFAG